MRKPITVKIIGAGWFNRKDSNHPVVYKQIFNTRHRKEE
jgi:hypothetical protein